MAQRRLGRVDRRPVAAHRIVDRPALGDIADIGTGCVRIDVVDVLGFQAGELYRPGHRLAGLHAIGIRRDDMEAVGGD